MGHTKISSAGLGHRRPTTVRSASSRQSCGRRWPIRADWPGDELAAAVEYDDGSDEKFLQRLWHDLYGDEPIGKS